MLDTKSLLKTLRQKAIHLFNKQLHTLTIKLKGNYDRSIKELFSLLLSITLYMSFQIIFKNN